MARYVEGKDRNQMTMFNCIDDYVEADSICRVIEAFVAKQNMSHLGFKYAETKDVGRCPYDPKVLSKVYLYGYLNHIRSSRRLEREMHRNVEMMWLTEGLTPDDKTISNFRKDNAKQFKKLFTSFNKLCMELNLFGKETVAEDGTKIKAQNGRKNYRTRKSTQQEIERLEKKLKKKFEQFMQEMDENDAKEAVEEVIDTEKVAEAIKNINEKKAYLESLLEKMDETEKDSVCTVDEDATLMKNGNNYGYDVSYNVEAAVDEKHGLIVEFDVTNSTNDINELSNISIKAKEALAVDKLNALADKGFSNGEEIKKCEDEGITCFIPKPKPSHQPEDKSYSRENFIYDEEKNIYVCPEGNELAYVRTRARGGYAVYANKTACMNCPNKSKCTKSKTRREIERSPYQSYADKAAQRAKENPDLYHRRQELSEHPFGIIKRIWGFNQFLCRGKEKATGETALAFLAVKLSRVINLMGAEKLIEALA
jgi:transposase